MERKAVKSSIKADFSEIVKSAYNKGVNDTELTLEKLLEDLEADLKHLLIC